MSRRLCRSVLGLTTRGLCKRRYHTIPEQKEVRELLVNVMDTTPSKRELQHFLKKFGKQDSFGSPRDYVNALLAPCYHQLALTKIEGPFEKNGWQNVGKTLYKLQKLGLTSIVVSDNPAWTLAEHTPSELRKRMVQESMTLVEAIEQAGGRAALIYGPTLERSNFSSTSIDVNLDLILSAINNHQIPIVVPILTEAEGNQVPVGANDALLALTQRLANQALDPKLVPSKIVIVNKEGGIPNHERPGTAHSLVNLQEEYSDIYTAFLNQHPEWQTAYPNMLENMTTIRDCLQQLPVTSSAVIAPTSSLPSALITNLVTDKPLYSSSLPVTDHTRINQAKTTVLRQGAKISNFQQVSDLNLPRLTELLEASFQRKVHVEKYYARLGQVLAGAIIAGDYEGAVIMTNERPSPDSSSYAYLDKFAIAPSSQGIGLTDILWKRMCDAYPELLWRSRKDNGVNKWYFERASGYLRLKNWVLFWHGQNGHHKIQDYAQIANSIPPSFM
ncbi:Amino-acid acetyltransferase, mitochondrial [Rhizopus azygosporus]|uniref:Amino-acid acetyltransferase, mitochondrial n=1 Tax=Rhizopus azygosporus TaxID=86630 RepID=A0A367JAP5_RHIAZ|nr:Amino-acid acetyltransferase, mitochondrial [Rhizopus azygosporus]